MGKATRRRRILDFTHVSRADLHAAAGLVRRRRDQGGAAGRGDITRGQLQDVPGADSLYFTMLNHNKRSITLDTKTPKGRRCWSDW